MSTLQHPTSLWLMSQRSAAAIAFSDDQRMETSSLRGYCHGQGLN
jgi:hypothetical protein